MPNDNQAKSYIEAVMARADGATKGPWILDGWQVWHDLGDQYPGFTGIEASKNCLTDKSRANLVFTVHARQDIPTLAKMLLRAIAALESIDDDDMRCCDVSVSEKIAHVALAEINAMAKGSQ